jgi:hypothetical protein
LIDIRELRDDSLVNAKDFAHVEIMESKYTVT